MAHPLLQHYIRLTEFLAALLGPYYEVVLHDLTDPDCSVIAIANGHISGRTIGAPLTQRALRTLADKKYLECDYETNFSGVAENSRKLLRCSTFYIRPQPHSVYSAGENAPVGMLCINFDDAHYRDVSEQVMKLCHPDLFVESNFVYDKNLVFEDRILPPESYPLNVRMATSVASAAENAIDQALGEKGVSAERLTQREKQEIVARLDEKGVFQMKGAVQQVAKRLHSSKASIYRYLKTSGGGDA